jgi:hypothetical protein
VQNTEEFCGDELMEPGWDEGYWCTRPPGHKPPHRMEQSPQEDLTGVDLEGRPYTWAYEWKYKGE